VLAPHTPSIRLDFSQYKPQARALEEGVYLICREALSNAIRHSGAARVDVRAAVVDDILTVTIQDDGCGFEVVAHAPADHEHGIGLHTMSERAAVLGGVCEVRSQPGQGTSVCIRLPLLTGTQ
jgi:signal transduction histidine kinase